MKEILIILRKELLEIFRNRSTFIILLLPVFIFPFLNLGLSYVNKDLDNTVNIALSCEDSYLKTMFDDFSAKTTEQKICLISTDNPTLLLENGIIDCFIKMKGNEIQFVFNPYSYNSLACATKLGESFEKFYHKNSSNTGTYAFALKDYDGNEADISASISNIITPILLLSILLKSTSGFAADLFAGERERKTLELLLLSGVSRRKIYLGKLSALLLLSSASAILSIFGWLSAYRNSLNLFGFMKSANIALNICAIVICLLSLSVLFVVIYTTTSLLTKSVRNTNFINDILSFLPMIIAIAFAITTIQTDNIFLYFIPVFNLTICFCDAFIGKADLLQLLTAFTSNAIFIFMLIFAGTRYMNSENFVR